MSIKNGTFLSGSPTLSATGGTSSTIGSLGQSSGTHEAFYMPAAGTQLQDRWLMTFTAKQPRANSGSPGGYTQARRKVVIKVPYEDTFNNTISYETISIELATDQRSVSSGTTQSLKSVAAQLLFDADFASFWDNLDVS